MHRRTDEAAVRGRGGATPSDGGGVRRGGRRVAVKEAGELIGDEEAWWRRLLGSGGGGGGGARAVADGVGSLRGAVAQSRDREQRSLATRERGKRPRRGGRGERLASDGSRGGNAAWHRVDGGRVAGPHARECVALAAHRCRTQRAVSGAPVVLLREAAEHGGLARARGANEQTDAPPRRQRRHARLDERAGAVALDVEGGRRRLERLVGDDGAAQHAPLRREEARRDALARRRQRRRRRRRRRQRAHKVGVVDPLVVADGHVWPCAGRRVEEQPAL